METPLDRFKALMAALGDRLAQFDTTLAEADLLRAQVFALPRVRQGEEHDVIKSIPTTLLEGPEAFAEARQSWRLFYAHQDDSTKAVARLPGVIQLHVEDPESLRTQIGQINQLKDQIDACIRTLAPRPDDRFDMVHRLFPYLINRQLVRHILVCPAEPAIQSVTYTWAQRTAIVRLTRDELCERLEKRKAAPPQAPAHPDSPFTPWPLRIDREIQRLRTLPASSTFQWRRAVKVRPVVNIRLETGEQRQREAHTPVLILNPPAHIKLGRLKDFALKPLRPRKGRLSASEPITDLLPAYQVLTDTPD
ncbi:MAG: DNA replication terminus site-binding protein [Gammaproteobacteria bacterium]|nr:DNA replication terminus site-binding protein [Gammaproteobacteria bacterium]